MSDGGAVAVRLVYVVGRLVTPQRHEWLGIYTTLEAAIRRCINSTGGGDPWFAAAALDADFPDGAPQPFTGARWPMRELLAAIDAEPECNCHPEEQTGGGHATTCPDFEQECTCYERFGLGHQPGCPMGAMVRKSPAELD